MGSGNQSWVTHLLQWEATLCLTLSESRFQTTEQEALYTTNSTSTLPRSSKKTHCPSWFFSANRKITALGDGGSWPRGLTQIVAETAFCFYVSLLVSKYFALSQNLDQHVRCLLSSGHRSTFCIFLVRTWAETSAFPFFLSHVQPGLVVFICLGVHSAPRGWWALKRALCSAEPESAYSTQPQNGLTRDCLSFGCTVLIPLHSSRPTSSNVLLCHLPVSCPLPPTISQLLIRGPRLKCQKTPSLKHKQLEQAAL